MDYESEHNPLNNNSKHIYSAYGMLGTILIAFPKRAYSQDWKVSSGCLSQDHVYQLHYFVWLVFLIMKFIFEEVFIFRFLIVLIYTGKSVSLAFRML